MEMPGTFLGKSDGKNKERSGSRVKGKGRYLVLTWRVLYFGWTGSKEVIRRRVKGKGDFHVLSWKVLYFGMDGEEQRGEWMRDGRQGGEGHRGRRGE
jgi:hypothetical protein